jgi:aspartyl/asparaginyl beta-hydroxylase (cupin superfamily)
MVDPYFARPPSAFLFWILGNGKQPRFHEPPETTFPWIKKLEANFQDILAEVEPLMTHASEVNSYSDYHSAMAPTLVSFLVMLGMGNAPAKESNAAAVGKPKAQWNFVLLRSRDDPPPSDITTAFPKTIALLDEIPKGDLLQARFSWLTPRKTIGSHFGSWAGTLVYHMGILMPNASSCDSGVLPSITVGDDVRTWQPGKSLIFEDTFYHSVDNQCDEPRVVLHLRVRRPPIGNVIADTVFRVVDPFYHWYVGRRAASLRTKVPVALLSKMT